MIRDFKFNGYAYGFRAFVCSLPLACVKGEAPTRGPHANHTPRRARRGHTTVLGYARPEALGTLCSDTRHTITTLRPDRRARRLRAALHV